MASLSSHLTSTPQTEPIFDRTDQVKNNAGGFVFQLDCWNQLDRFLILGSEGGTYYATERKLTVDNAKNVLACIEEDGVRVVKTIVEISRSGRAPKNDPALFALALCSTKGDLVCRQAANEALPSVARIGTHLHHFANYVDDLSGWSRGRRRQLVTGTTTNQLSR